METNCNSDYDGSPDVSVEEEEDEEPQEEGLTCSSFKKLNHNETVKWKLADVMGATQSEESGLMWETSSSRCSTSQASETSATSGVYSMENSFMDCPSGKSMFSMDEEKIALRRNSPDHTPLSPDEKISPGSTKAQEKEYDPADPQSWPFQVQPSKIKDYLVLITQDMGTSSSEEKENPLMKKGELPLKGTVRARIQLITAVLEERHKKIFRRVNNKDVPPPSDVIKKPREQPKIFSRQGISVSLRHIERDATDKNNRKEIPRYNLKHVGTGISKPGVSVPSYKDEKRTRRSFLPEILNKASEKPPPISSILANKAKKPDIKSYSPRNQTPIPEQASLVQPDLPDKTEVRKAQSLPLSSAKIMPENSTNLHAERGKQKMQDYSPVTTEDTDGSKKSLPERELAESCSPFSYPASEAEMQPAPTAMVPSEATAQEVQYSNNTAATLQETEKSVSVQARNQDFEFSAPSQLDTEDTAVFHFAEAAGNQNIPLYSPERKQAELPSVSETEEQEKEQPGMGYPKVAAVQEQLTVSLQAESDHLPLLPSIKEIKAGEIEALPDLSAAARRTEAQELQSDSYKSAKRPLPSYVTGGAEHEEKEYQESEFIKQAVQAQSAVTTPLEPDHSDVSQSRGKGENQTAVPESQCPDSSLPVAYEDREEIQSNSPAIAQSDSEHPAIFEPAKVPQGSEPTEPLHLRDKEEKQYSPTEELNLSEQLPSISSLLSESTEKQGTPLPSVVTAASLSKHPAWPAEQTETHEGLSSPPETATVAAETPFTTGTLQNVNVTDVEMQPLSPTEVPREELLPISREPDVLKDRKTTQLVSSLSAEPLNAASVSPKEEEKLENQFGAPMNAKLCSEEQDVSRPIINESQQEGQINSFESGSFGLEHSTESQPKKQSMGQNFSLSSQLEETTALHSIDEGDKKDKHSDKPFFELLDADLLQSASALDKQKPQSNIEQTTQQLLHTILPIESDMLPSVEETQINGSSSHFPGKKQNLDHTIKLIETEENQNVLRGNAALDSRYSAIPSPKAEEETDIPTEPEAQSMEKQSIEVETSGLEADFQDVSYSVCESDKHLDASVPLPSTEGRDLQSHLPMTPELDYKIPIPAEREKEEKEHYSLIIPTKKVESLTTASEPEKSPDAAFNSSRIEAAKPSPVMESSVPDETKDQTVAKESIETSVLASKQTDYLSPDLKGKAELEESHFLLPVLTPERGLDETPSFTAFPIAGDQVEALHSPMAPKTVPQESNSVPENSIPEEVEEMAPPVSPLSAELLLDKTFSSCAASVEEKQDLSLHMEKQSIEAETSGLEADFQDVSYSVSESDKHLDASVPLPSTEEGDLQSCLRMIPDLECKSSSSAEWETEEKEHYSFVTPTTKVESPTIASEPERSPDAAFNSSLIEAAKPSPVMESSVPDETKDQTFAKESIETSVLASEQTNYHSPDLKGKAELEESHFLLPVLTPELGLDETPSFTAFPISGDRVEALHSPMAPKTVPQESNSVPENSIPEEIKGMVPPVSPLPAELPSHEPLSSYALSVGEKQDLSLCMEKQRIEAQTSGLGPDFQDVSYSVSESDKHLDASVRIPSSEEGDLQSRLPMTPDLDFKSPILAKTEGEEREFYSLLTQKSKVESPPTASEPEKSPDVSFNNSLNEGSKPSPVMESSFPDEIKEQAVSKKSKETSVLASEQTNYFSPDRKGKAELEESHFLLPVLTPERGLDETPSFTAFPIAGDQVEALHSPMAPKTVPQESNSVPENSIPEEVEGMAPPFSPLSAELLSHETFSAHAVSAGEKQDLSLHVEKQSIEAAPSGLESDFQDLSRSTSDSDKCREANIASTEHLQSQQPVTPEMKYKSPISAERDEEESDLYSLIIPTSKLESPSAASEPERSQDAAFNSSRIEAPKPSPVMESSVSDETKDQAVAKESIETSVLASEQTNYLSPDLKGKAELEESHFLLPVLTPERGLDETASFTAFLIAEAKKDSPMARKTVPQESNSIPEDSVSEEVERMAPPVSPLSAELLSHEMFSSCALSADEKQDQSRYFDSPVTHVLAPGKVGIQDAQSHLLVTAQSEMIAQDTKACCPEPAQLKHEDLTLLDSTEEIKEQETPLHSFPTGPSAPLHQESLCNKGEEEIQERVLLQTEHSKEHAVLSKSSIMQQELEQLKSLESGKESSIEEIQPFSSTFVQDSPKLPGETGSQGQQDYLLQTAELDSVASMLSQLMDEAKKQELHQPPPGDLSCSSEIQLHSPEAQNQNSEKSPAVSSFLSEKVEEQQVNSRPSAVAVPSPSSALPEVSDTDKKQQGAKEMPEESLSITAFLLSEAKAMRARCPLPSETGNLDAQPPSKEDGLLKERSGTALALLPETNVTIKREAEPSLTLFESEQLTNKPQTDIISSCSLEERTENISDIPTLPQIEPSCALILKPINDTHAHDPDSSVNSADSNTMDSKTMVINQVVLAKTEEETYLPSVDRDLKEPEKYLQKEKGLEDDEKQRELIPAPELDQEKDTFSISEGYQVGKIQAPPLISPVDKDKHMLESLEYLEAVPLLKTKPFHDTEDVVLQQEPSVGKILEGLKADIHENKGNESKELTKANGVQESAETTIEVSAIPENKCDGILKASDIDYFEKYTLTDDTSFTQTGKEQSIKEVQRSFDITNEHSEERTSPVSSSESILKISSLEKDLDKAKKGNATITHEATSKILNEAAATKGNSENTAGELNLLAADAPLFNTGKDVLCQSPLTPLPTTVVSPEEEAPPALSFLYEDLYEGVVEELKEDSSKYPPNEKTEYTGNDFHIRGHASDGSGIYCKKDIPDDSVPNTSEESQTEKVLKNQSIIGQALDEARVTESAWEPSEKKHEPPHIPAEAPAPGGVISPTGVMESQNNTLIESPAEIISDVKVEICQPTYAIPFGSGFYSSGASNDDSGQIREQYVTEETGQVLPEETSDEESSPILDYAATVYQHEASVQNEAQEVADLAVDQSQQYEITEVHEMYNDVIKPLEESPRSFEASQDADSHRQNEGQAEGNLMAAIDESMTQEAHLLDHNHLACQETERRQASEQSVGEYTVHDLTELNRETTDQQEPKELSDQPFVELDYSLLSHEFDTYPLYSIKEEEYSDIDEDLAELMDYEVVARDDVFQEEISSETAHEELLLDDRKSLDHISDTYEFVNERQASMYPEEEEFELMNSEKLPRNIPETEILQKEIEQAQLDSYCYQCQCPISGEDKLFGEHKEHDVTDLDRAATVLKSQLVGSLDVLQERSLKIEGFVGEIEALFNSLEENCKEKEQLLEEQNESIIKMVVENHDRKAQRFEEIKNTKMEYLYEQMVNFQDCIDTAKDTLETIIKETEGMDDFVFLQSSEEINKRLLSAVEEIITVEKMPAAFAHFEHYAGGSANADQTLTHMPVPQTPKLQPQDPNSATSTSIAVYWTVNEDDVIDFFQVYCMEKCPGNKEQSGLVEEYRVTVKESNCILEDLEPGYCYSVWVMAVNYTGCSFPSEKSTFRTAPPTPVINAEECTICWDTATIRWTTSRPEATDSFTLEYCRQYSPEGEGLRSLAGIKRPEMKVRLESNVNYFFYVRAVNSFGTSEQSEAALISTKGTRFHLMRETTHPALHVSPNGTMISLPKDSKLTGCVYKVLHKGEMSEVMVTEEPARIGILLDYNTGRLLFFNAERGQMLTSIRHKFTEAVHPAFVLEQPGVLNLHTGMELPEFVEQS